MKPKLTPAEVLEVHRDFDDWRSAHSRRTPFPDALWAAAALHYRTRRRWPSTPYRAAVPVGRLAMRADIAAVYRLRPSVLNVVNGLSSI